ncbi:hypothetical protein HD554DRAFT_2098596 [Boletus coccyginus]|nr:hypothetical protein HD554DRAFT_2098596 [Boletus coccyginus]
MKVATGTALHLVIQWGIVGQGTSAIRVQGAPCPMVLRGVVLFRCGIDLSWGRAGLPWMPGVRSACRRLSRLSAPGGPSFRLRRVRLGSPTRAAW